jgi:transposase
VEIEGVFGRPSNRGMVASGGEPKQMSRGKFSAELKAKLVDEHVTGGRAISQICRTYGVGETALRRWVSQYRRDGADGLVSNDAKTRELADAQERIAELEAALGRAAMELDFMQRAFKRAGLPFPNQRRS